MKLKDRVAIVTGGGTGMGRAIAKRLGAEGAAVVVNYRASRAEAEEVAAEIEAAGGTALALQADVADERQVRAMVAEVEERWGRLDILVNNAGWSKITPHWELDALTDEIWDRTLDTNLRGAFYCVRAAVPLMRSSGGGSIVNNTSASAFTAAGSTIVYSASKAAMMNMTKSLARGACAGNSSQRRRSRPDRDSFRRLAGRGFRVVAESVALEANPDRRRGCGNRAVSGFRRRRGDYRRDDPGRLRPDATGPRPQARSKVARPAAWPRASALRMERAEYNRGA